MSIAVEKFTLILQFMLDSEVVGVEHQSFHHTLKVSLAHGFCLLTQLIQDKNSSVCSRVRYCITSIKESSLEVSSFCVCMKFERVCIMKCVCL